MIENKVVDIPTLWMDIYNKHLESITDPEAVTFTDDEIDNLDSDDEGDSNSNRSSNLVVAKKEKIRKLNREEKNALAAKEAEGRAARRATGTVEALSTQFAMPVKEVDEILKRMLLHMHRMGNLEAATEYMEGKYGLLARLENFGVKTQFQEISIKNKDSTLAGDYYPTLFGDDDYERVERDLISRIKRETKAKLVHFDGSRPFGVKGVLTKGELPADSSNKAGVERSNFSRWKVAFRDLSKLTTQPTMVRTRVGVWRQATALEESQRSWVQNPTKLDMEIYRDQIQKFVDPDGDDAEFEMFNEKRNKRREAIKSKLQNSI